MPFKIIRGDITNLPFNVDAIVNSANHEPSKELYGTDGAIHRAAGFDDLYESRKAIGNNGIIEFGDAVITDAFNLKPRVHFIVHAVAPIYHGGVSGESASLNSCYKKALMLAIKNECRSIAFPIMATGINSFPKREALKIAIEAITDFLFENLDYQIEVTLVIFDREIFELCESIFPNVEEHLDDELIKALAHEEYSGDLKSLQVRQREQKTPEIYVRSFNEEIFHLIGECIEQGLYRTTAEVFNKANVSIKVRSDMILREKEYKPHRNTAIRFALALELSLNETKRLLSKAQYSLADNNPFDLVIIDCINKKIFDVWKVDRLLKKKGLDSIMPKERIAR